MILRTLHCTNIICVVLLTILVLDLEVLITCEAKANLISNAVFVRETNLNDDHASEGGGLGPHEQPRPSLGREKVQTILLPNTSVVPSSIVESQSQKELTNTNSSVISAGPGRLDKKYKLTSAALLRAFYVFGGLSAVVMMYILVRTIRLRRKKTTVRKYGILTNREDVEMTPLGAEDDEDTTLFELNNHTRT